MCVLQALHHAEQTLLCLTSVDPVDQEGTQDCFDHYLDGKKNETQCIVISLELFMIVEIKVGKKCSLFLFILPWV